MLPDFLPHIYRDALVPGEMPVLMEKIGQLFGAESSFMFSSHSNLAPEAVLLGQNMCPDAIESFRTQWSQEDPWAAAATRKGMMKRNVVVTGTELVPAAELQRSRFHNEFGRRNGMEHLLGSVLFDGTEGRDLPFINLCWYRAFGSDDFERDHIRLLRALLPHLQQALVIQQQVRSLTINVELGACASTGLGIASFVLDEAARPIEMNANGMTLLSSRTPFVRFSNGTIRQIGQRCAPAFDDAMRICRANGQAVRILAQCGGSGRLMRATLSPLPIDTRTFLGWQHDRRYLLLLELPRDDQPEVVRRAADLFGLTEAESDVMVHLLAGLSAEQIARERDSSLNTVRAQLRSILDKVGVGRQIDLIRLLARLA